MLWPTAVTKACIRSLLVARQHERGLLPLCHLPQIFRNNPKFGRFLNDPVRLRVEAGLPLAAARVFDETLSVPDYLTDIHLIVENTGPTLAIAVNCTRPPETAGRALNTLAIKFERNRLGRLAIDVVAENAKDDICLDLIDRPVAALQLANGIHSPDDIISVRIASARFSEFNASAQATSYTKVR